MTKEEFLQGFREAIEDANDPNSDVGMIIKEGQELADEMREHDPVIANKITAITVAIDDLRNYILERGENL